MEDKEMKKQIEEIVEHKKQGLWIGRMDSKDYPIGETIFTIEGLKSDITMFCTSKATSYTEKGLPVVDNAIAGWWAVKFGLKKVSGLFAKQLDKNGNSIQVDLDFETVKVFNTTYDVITDDFLCGLNPAIINTLYWIIQILTYGTDQEKEALDFSSASVAPELNATNLASEPGAKPGKKKQTNSQSKSNAEKQELEVLEQV
jgi:hypothetical protein